MLARVRRRTDMAACGELVRAVHEADGYPVRLTPDPADFLRVPGTLGAWVAEDRTGLVGHVLLGRRSAEPVMAAAEEATGLVASRLAVVGRLLVAPRARRLGAGRSLLGVPTARLRARAAARPRRRARPASGGRPRRGGFGARRSGHRPLRGPRLRRARLPRPRAGPPAGAEPRRYAPAVTAPFLAWEDFASVDERVGRVVEVAAFPEARKPAWQLTIDFGSEVGVKRSSAQITNYAREELLGRLVLAVVNLAPRQIGPFRSEVLTLGTFRDTAVLLVEPDPRAQPGDRLG